MAALTRHGAPVSSVFDLLGANENDLTSALGFALSRAPSLLEAVVRRVWPGTTAADLDAASLAVEVCGEVGRTDLQIMLPEALVIVEAKRTDFTVGGSATRLRTAGTHVWRGDARDAIAGK